MLGMDEIKAQSYLRWGLKGIGNIQDPTAELVINELILTIAQTIEANNKMIAVALESAGVYPPKR